MNKQYTGMAPPPQIIYNPQEVWMLERFNINHKKLVESLIFGSLLCLSFILIAPTSASAADLPPSVTVKFYDIRNNNTLQPNTLAPSTSAFYLPVEINMTNVSKLAVSVQAKTTDLVGRNNPEHRIKSVEDNGTGYQLSDLRNQWGYRWEIGDTMPTDASQLTNTKNYGSVPSVATTLGGPITINSGSATKYLTLGFGVSVDGETPTGYYDNIITVSVTATPLSNVFGGITYMQEMTSAICAAATTPSASVLNTTENTSSSDLAWQANHIDETGEHHGDPNYVPQATLVDKRDGKRYLVRKLADGKCWMASNLEFDFVPDSAKNKNDASAQIGASTDPSAFKTNEVLANNALKLTNEDTDLNTVTEWTPANYTTYTTQNTTGVVWGEDGTDGLRSISQWYGVGTDKDGYQIARTYSKKTGINKYIVTTEEGELYQRFGNLYNWTAATLGSGVNLINDGQRAPNSICPKGWRLPQYGNDSGSFGKLIVITYGLTPNTGTAFSNANLLNNFPLNYLRSGLYNFDSDALLAFRASNTGGWTDSVGTSLHIYVFGSNWRDWGVDSLNDKRGDGFPIRCVAR